MKKFFVGVLLASTLIGCTTTDGTMSPAKTVYEIESSYAAAATIAAAYIALPVCGQSMSPVLCAQPVVVLQLKQADTVAYPLLIAAQNTARTSGSGANTATAIVAAQQAIQALTAITTTLNLGK